jgi:hypothetical protein
MSKSNHKQRKRDVTEKNNNNNAAAVLSLNNSSNNSNLNDNNNSVWTFNLDSQFNFAPTNNNTSNTNNNSQFNFNFAMPDTNNFNFSNYADNSNNNSNSNNVSNPETINSNFNFSNTDNSGVKYHFSIPLPKSQSQRGKKLKILKFNPVRIIRDDTNDINDSNNNTNNNHNNMLDDVPTITDNRFGSMISTLASSMMSYFPLNISARSVSHINKHYNNIYKQQSNVHWRTVELNLLIDGDVSRDYELCFKQLPALQQLSMELYGAKQFICQEIIQLISKYCKNLVQLSISEDMLQDIGSDLFERV